MVSRIPNEPEPPADLLASDPLDVWFERFRPALLGLISKSAGSLLRHEPLEDLLGGIRARATARTGLVNERGDGQLSAWLLMIARQYLADRFEHWNGLRRDATALLRVVDVIAVPVHGRAESRPLSFTARREQMELATLALAGLPAGERRILRLVGEGASAEQISIHLGMPRDEASAVTQAAIAQFRAALTSLQRQPIRPR